VDACKTNNGEIVTDKSQQKTQFKWAVVGGGQMGRALVGGMIKSGVVSSSSVILVEPNESSRQWWSQNQPDVQHSELDQAVKLADGIILAVKPGIIPTVMNQAGGFWSGKLLVSIAAGFPLKKLCELAGHRRVVRVMPNTPCLVGRGACAFCCGEEVADTDRSLVASALEAVGIAAEVSDGQMDAVTGLSGSGPAYVYVLIEALADGGVAAGLPRDLAMELAAQTVVGAGEMVQKTNLHPGQLKDAVASPGGTTIAGLQALEQNGVRAAMIAAVKASAERSKELA
jgi:pyrroline-5-carboxylate reductase